MEKAKNPQATYQNEEKRYCNLRVSKETFSALTSLFGTSPCFPFAKEQEKQKKND